MLSMKHGLLILVLIIGALAEVRAQHIRFGPEAGISFTSMALQHNGNKQKPASIKGLRAGVVTDIKLSDMVSLQPAILYTAKGYKTSNSTLTSNNIEIPMNLQGKFLFGPGFFFVGGGPYIGYIINGETAANNNTARESPDQKTAIRTGNSATDDIRPLDLGMNLNTGYLIKNGVFIRGNAGLGLRNLQPGGNSGFSQRNASISLTVGYLIGK
jgi:hypothetical protein